MHQGSFRSNANIITLNQVPATRAAAEQVMTQFRQIPKVLPACQYILGNKKRLVKLTPRLIEILRQNMHNRPWFNFKFL